MTDTITESDTAHRTRNVSGPARPARRVQLPWLAVALVTAIGVALVVLWGFGRASDRREVLVVRQPVAAGTPITPEVLGVVEIAVDDGATQLYVPDQRDELVGQVAAVDLRPGDLVGPSLVSPEPAVPPGAEHVGAIVDVGRYPATIRRGDTVRAVPLDDAAAPAVVTVIDATIRDDDSALVAVLAAPADRAAEVARWAARDNVALVRQGDNG